MNGNMEENVVYELCPHCCCEVELINEFKVQICPNCGKYIVACSLCPLLEENKCQVNCPLEMQERKLNNERLS